MDRLDNFASAMSALGQDIASLLLPKARLNRRFVEASSHLAIESLQEWLAQGADPSVLDRDRKTPKELAYSRLEPELREIIKLLPD